MSKIYPHIPDCFYRVSVKCLIENKSGDFLLCLEDNGFWDIPGGGIDHGEDTQEAIRREIFEEMGLKVISISDEPVLVCLSQSNGISGSINPIALILYKVEVENLDFTPSSECQEIGFFDYESVRNIPVYQGSKKIFDLLKKRKT